MTHWVEFEAGQVEVQGDLQRIELADDVAVTSGRFRLAGEEFTITQGPRGVEVDGRGRLSLCPCDTAPLSVGFRSATMAAPTDLLLENATPRIAGVPILWLPWFWLRSTRRIGLLPPQLSWRAEDGAFVGAGVHLPLMPEDRAARDFVDLRAGGYTKGGVETRGDVVWKHHVLRGRWDHVGRTLLDLEGHGVSRASDAGYVAWQVDALRGARAVRGTPDLRRAMRRHDRWRLTVARATAHWVGGAGLRSDMRRGGELDDQGAFGPYALLGTTFPLGQSGVLTADADLRSATHSTQGNVSVGQRLGTRVVAHPQPFALSAEVGENLIATTTGTNEEVSAEVQARLALTLPLVREFGRSRDPVVHWLEPGIAVRSGLSDTPGPLTEQLRRVRDSTARVQGLWAATASLHNAVGTRHRRSAGSLRLEAGWAGEAEDPDPLVGAWTAMSGRHGALSASSAWSPQALAAVAQGRLGRVQGTHVHGFVEGVLSEQPILSRWVRSAAGEPALGNWFDAGGWSGGGGMGVPVFGHVILSAEIDADLQAQEVLAIGTKFAYDHPCGCLSVVGSGGHRVGRGGWDIWVALDLVP